MIKGLYGVNIAIKDDNFEEAVKKYEAIFDIEPRMMAAEDFAIPGHRGASFTIGGVMINLIAGKPGSTTAGFVEKRGEGLQLISLETTDIKADMSKMVEGGLVFTSEKPIDTPNGNQYAFVHPKSTNGVQIELGRLVVR
ncbi:VOC family protein [Chloroflexota bacterium]